MYLADCERDERKTEDLVEATRLELDQESIRKLSDASRPAATATRTA
jgi:hypothetical protein